MSGRWAASGPTIGTVWVDGRLIPSVTEPKMVETLVVVELTKEAVYWSTVFEINLIANTIYF